VSPLASVLVIGSIALGYVCLSAAIVGSHTDKDLLPRRWLGLKARPNASRRGWLIVETVVLVAATSVTQWAMATVVIDETQATYLRLLAAIELGVALAWTSYAIVVLTRSGGRAA
jgi:hypothetical protein